MPTSPFQVIEATRSAVAQLTLLRAEGEIQRVIQRCPGTVDYFTTFEVRVAGEVDDNDVYAIKTLLKQAGWANVMIIGGILYFDFPSINAA